MKFNDSIVGADWSAMNNRQQREYFGDNGFVLVPGALSISEVSALLAAVQAHNLPSRAEDELWHVPEFVALIDNATVLGALRDILGEDLRFFKGAYVATPPGAPPQILHLDQGTSGFSGDHRNSSASWINVGFYLTDLSPDHSPLWVVPGSNKQYHLVPGTDLENMKPDAKMVLAKAGDAVLFHRSTVHAGGANCSASTRHGVFFSYRPAWAKPTGPIPEWPSSLVQQIHVEHRSLVGGLNDGF